MLYVLYGTDTATARDKLHALVARLVQKRPDAALLHVDQDSFEPASLDELIYGQGLFSGKSIIVLDRVCAAAEHAHALHERLADIGTSENILVVFEEKLDAKTRAKLERHAEKVQHFDAGGSKKERFNVFSIADALGRRDRKMLWVLYQKAKRAGISDEEIHGLLAWQVKALLLSNEAENASAAGLNPFVYKKAKGFLRHFSKTELTAYSRDLVLLYHEARHGTYELGAALERWVLAI